MTPSLVRSAPAIAGSATWQAPPHAAGAARAPGGQGDLDEAKEQVPSREELKKATGVTVNKCAVLTLASVVDV